jgi:hypothetical protein
MKSALLILLLTQNLFASALHSDLRDVAQFAPQELPLAQMVLTDIEANPEKYFQIKPAEVHGIELYDEPYQQNSTWIIPILALISFDKKNLFFRRLEVLANTAIESVRALEEIPLAQTQFSIEVGLIPRTMVLTDSRFGIKKIYPLGVGGIDAVTKPGKIRIVTPLFKDAGLQKRFVIAKRTEPSYYQGKPFLRITSKGGLWTAIGFHIQQNKIFVRGFDSHGCMRLRNKDLRELFQIVTKGSLEEMPLQVGFSVSEKNDHPYPQFTEYYKAIKNFGTVLKPLIKRDEFGLVIMEKIAGVPDISRITGGQPPSLFPEGLTDETHSLLPWH